MGEQFDFRALLIKLQDCLSDNDRRRLHFIVGDTIPRHIRDDPSLAGTLTLLESLFDRAKISEQDFDYLIQAFREIHCYEGVKRLKGICHILVILLYALLLEYQSVKQRNLSPESRMIDIIDDNEDDKVRVSSEFSSLLFVLQDKQHIVIV